MLEKLTSFHEVQISNGCHDLELYANPMMEKVFHNLVDNSVRHGGNVSKINLCCSEDHHGLSLVLTDDGIGIPIKDKERIFSPGYGKNTGLGLFLIREILNMTQITIKENGTEGQGARFELQVPRGTFRHKNRALNATNGEFRPED
jgi:signal transduction histidine kinase